MESRINLRGYIEIILRSNLTSDIDMHVQLSEANRTFYYQSSKITYRWFANLGCLFESHLSCYLWISAFLLLPHPVKEYHQLPKDIIQCNNNQSNPNSNEHYHINSHGTRIYSRQLTYGNTIVAINKWTTHQTIMCKSCSFSLPCGKDFAQVTSIFGLDCVLELR